MSAKLKLEFSILFALFFSLSSCQPRNLVAPAPVIDDPACKKTYSDLFSPDHLDFRIVFGYKDARPARYVGDRYERAYFVQTLLQFGFKRSKENESEFVYYLTGLDGHAKEVKLQVVNGSVGPDDDENRKDPFQAWQSHRAETTFLDGLQNADLVFYYGHSRAGGGPDFSPPLLDRNHHVNYGWYQKHHPGLDKMILALRKMKRAENTIGLYSCISGRLFSKKLQQANPKIHLLVSKTLLYYSDALNGMMETLQDILEMKCQKDFHPFGTEPVHFFKAGELTTTARGTGT
jgi:hypothetical protein